MTEPRNDTFQIVMGIGLCISVCLLSLLYFMLCDLKINIVCLCLVDKRAGLGNSTMNLGKLESGEKGVDQHTTKFAVALLIMFFAQQAFSCVLHCSYIPFI